MKTLFILQIVFAPIFIFAQPNVQWQKTIGGNLADELFISIGTKDGGLALGGYSYSDSSGNKTSNSRGGQDYWIVKLDSTGNVIWDKTFGGMNNDVLFDLEQTFDNGYILGGRSESDSSGDKNSQSFGVTDIWLIKTDSLGNIEWQKSYGGNDEEYFNSIQQTQDHGYIIGGSSFSNISGNKTENKIGGMDLWIIKIDSLGNIEWQKTIGGTDGDFLKKVLQTNDLGFIVGSYSSSNISGHKTENSKGAEDYWILKIDSSGNILWQKTIGGSDTDRLIDIALTVDSGFILGGNSASNISGSKTENSRGAFDNWILKVSNTGNILWQKTLGGAVNDIFYSFIQDHNGNIIIGGYSLSDISGDKTEASNGFEDYWIIQLYASGAYQWQKSFGGDSDDELRSICFTTDDHVIFAGSSLSGISGDKSEPVIGLSDFWIINTNITTNIVTPGDDDNFYFFPNPATNFLYIYSKFSMKVEVKIFDIRGAELFRQETHFIYGPTVIDLEFLSAGVYVIALNDSKGEKFTSQFIKTK